jgi:AcrR family transcriptional regulator
MRRHETKISGKEEILKAALWCFNKKGYHKASVEEIAKKAGLTKGAIYYYFKSKKHLFIELLHHVFEEYNKKLAKDIAYGSIKDPVGKLKFLIKKDLGYIEKHLDALKFFINFIIISMREKDLRKEIIQYYQSMTQGVVGIIVEGQRRGEIKKIDPNNTAWVLNIFGIGYLIFYLLELDDIIDFDTLIDSSMEIILNGILETKS